MREAGDPFSGMPVNEWAGIGDRRVLPMRYVMKL
jgi:hypothetical protein